MAYERSMRERSMGRTRSSLEKLTRRATVADLGGIIERARRRAGTWLRRRDYLDERPLEDRSNEPEAQTALDACAVIAMGRGQVATLPRPGAADTADEDHEQPPDKTAVAVEHQGFNLHADVRIERFPLGCPTPRATHVHLRLCSAYARKS
jgi:hypothetical protein